MADKNTTSKKKQTVDEANKERIAQSKKLEEERKAKLKEAEDKLPMRTEVLKILNSIDGIEIKRVRETKKDEKEICTNCSERANFSFPGLNKCLIQACTEYCGLQTLQTQFVVNYETMKKEGAPQAVAQALAGAQQIVAAMAEIPNYEKAARPVALHEFNKRAKEAIEEAKKEMAKRTAIVGSNFEKKSSDTYKTQEPVRIMLQKVVSDEMLKHFNGEPVDPKYGANFVALVEELSETKRKMGSEIRHSQVQLEALKEHTKKNNEEAAEPPLEAAIAMLGEFFKNEDVQAFLEKAEPIMQERDTLEEQLDHNATKLAECNSLAMKTKYDEIMGRAKPIFVVMKKFDQLIQIAKAEDKKAECQARLQAKTEEIQKKMFKELITEDSIKKIEAMKDWDENHVPVADPPKNTWTEKLEEMEKAIEISSKLEIFMQQRNQCFQRGTEKLFADARSKIEGNKDLQDEKKKARVFSASYDAERVAHIATKKAITEMKAKVKAAEELMGEYKIGYDNAKTELEELRTFHKYGEKFFGAGAKKRGSPSGWEKVKGTKKPKTEKKVFLPITYPDEKGNQVPYCHFQFSKIDGCIKEDECEYADTHGMEDPHPNHYTRATVNAARQAAYEKEEAKKQKEKKKVAPTGAKPAAKPAKIPKKPDQKKKEVKFEQPEEESSSDTEDEPDDEPEADQGSQDAFD